MREVVLDTETTGLRWDAGDRLVEVGCVELLDGQRTDREWHSYINPEREVPEESVRVHGLSEAFLSDKPVFAGIAESLLEFLRGARLVIHNAEFDLGFLADAYRRCGMGDALSAHEVCDTVALARERFPGERASLDALCRRFRIDIGERKVKGGHGALLDARLLALVYQELTGGIQGKLDLSAGGGAVFRGQRTGSRAPRTPVVIVPSPEECAAHRATVAQLHGKTLWGDDEPGAGR